MILHLCNHLFQHLPPLILSMTFRHLHLCHNHSALRPLLPTPGTIIVHMLCYHATLPHLPCKFLIKVHHILCPLLFLLSNAHKYFVLAISYSTEPSNFLEEILDPHWQAIMAKELHALEQNKTWSLCTLSLIRIPLVASGFIESSIGQMDPWKDTKHNLWQKGTTKKKASIIMKLSVWLLSLSLFGALLL